MAISDALEELTKRWPDIARHLSRDEISSIRRQLAAFVHGVPWEPSSILTTAMTGQPDDHPVWEALLATGTRREGSPSLPLTVAAIQLRFAIEIDNATEAPEPESVENAAEERIMLAPMTDSDSHQPSLLVIPHDGGRLAPAFQFSDIGELLDHVAEINRLLDAAHEPWGAASWWLSPHPTLHGIPADLIRHDDPATVKAAAAAAADLA